MLQLNDQFSYTAICRPVFMTKWSSRDRGFYYTFLNGFISHTNWIHWELVSVAEWWQFLFFLLVYWLIALLLTNKVNFVIVRNADIAWEILVCVAIFDMETDVDGEANKFREFGECSMRIMQGARGMAEWNVTRKEKRRVFSPPISIDISRHSVTFVVQQLNVLAFPHTHRAPIHFF